MIAGLRHLTLESEIETQGLGRGARPPVRPQYARRWPFLALTAISVIGCRNWAEKKPAAVSNAAEKAGLQERLAKVDAILEQQREEQNLPGLSFVIVEDDKVVYLKAFGVRDLENELPATPDTVFPIGSCTKAFTSMAVAISQDEGKLSLND